VSDWAGIVRGRQGKTRARGKGENDIPSFGERLGGHSLGVGEEIRDPDRDDFTVLDGHLRDLRDNDALQDASEDAIQA
jgi:hypothetical protein